MDGRHEARPTLTSDPSGQSTPPPPLPIAVRRARPEDREAVVAFASDTFGGWDYVPAAWPDWIAAPDGVLLVATPVPPDPAIDPGLDPARPIGVCHVCVLSEGEAWFEGMRVDPRARGRSVATTLQVAELHWAAAHGARVVRYTTGESNEGSHRLGARHGFRLAGVRLMYFPPSADDAMRRTSLSVAELGALVAARREQRRSALARLAGLVLPPGAGTGPWWSLVEGSKDFEAGGRLYEWRPWSLQELTRDRFEAHVRAGEVLAWPADGSGAVAEPRAGSALAILPRRASGEDLDLHLGLLVGARSAALELVRSVRDAAGVLPRVWLPEPSPLAGDGADLVGLGYERDDSTLHLLERPADVPLPDVDETVLVFVEQPAPIARAGLIGSS